MKPREIFYTFKSPGDTVSGPDKSEIVLMREVMPDEDNFLNLAHNRAIKAETKVSNIQRQLDRTQRSLEKAKEALEFAVKRYDTGYELHEVFLKSKNALKEIEAIEKGEK